MKTYRVLAYLIALEVVLQAAAIAFGMAGLAHWVHDEGHTATRATFEEGGPHYTGEAGFSLHGVNGSLVIPILALVFLGVGFFARRTVRGGLRWSATVLGLVVLQVFLGFMTREVDWLGALHGFNALAVFSAALYAARRPRAELAEAGSGTLSPLRPSVRAAPRRAP